MPITDKEKKVKEKKVMCEFCKKPIHIDHWGGVLVNKKSKGREIWYCDNIICLFELNDKYL